MSHLSSNHCEEPAGSKLMLQSYARPAAHKSEHGFMACPGPHWHRDTHQCTCMQSINQDGVAGASQPLPPFHRATQKMFACRCCLQSPILATHTTCSDPPFSLLYTIGCRSAIRRPSIQEGTLLMPLPYLGYACSTMEWTEAAAAAAAAGQAVARLKEWWISNYVEMWISISWSLRCFLSCVAECLRMNHEA